MCIYYQNLAMTEIPDTLSRKKLFIPIGTIEQHGPHLPLSVDVDIPTALAQQLCEIHSAVLAPAINYGARSLPQSGGGPSFPGTIAIPAEILIGYYREIFRSFYLAGANDIVIINGHYENEPFIFEALEQCRVNGYLANKVIALSWWSAVKQDLVDKLFKNVFPGWHAEHAGLVETSLMLYLFPDKVKSIKINHDTPPLAGVYIHPIDPEVISNQGVLAKTEGASKEIGKILFDHICHQLIQLIQSPHGMKI